MREGARAVLEAAGMLITALSAQAMIRGLLDRDSEPLWGVFAWVPGGLAGQLVLLGFVALVAVVSGGWARTRREPDAERAGDSGRARGREPA
ncbi:hypothetical protein [Streptosporangium sp. NPDC002524]|uniref:hypothetical protein n=1 Tax=Streptosporangium sp. NPDC002524 TaxID=3154537 RepID=UPI003322B978